jgi:hypothetical protein
MVVIIVEPTVTLGGVAWNQRHCHGQSSASSSDSDGGFEWWWIIIIGYGGYIIYHLIKK